MPGSAKLDHGRRVHALLLQALELEPAERRRVLESAEPDRALVAEALELLAAENEEFLVHSPADALMGQRGESAP